MVRDFNHIALNNFFGWFLFDLIASFPISSIIDIMYIINNFDHSFTSSVGKINSVIKFIKFYRLIKFSAIIRTFKLTEDNKSKDKKNKGNSISLIENLNVTSAYKRLFKFLSGFFIISHVITGVWIYLGTLDQPNWIY